MIMDLQDAGVRTIYYNPDDPMLFDAVSKHLASVCDHVLAFPKIIPTYKEELGIDAIPFFYCVDPVIVKEGAPIDALKSDILLTGNIDMNRKKTRGEYIHALHKAQIGTVAYYGPNHLREVSYLRDIYRGELSGNEEHSHVVNSTKIIFHYTQELTESDYRETIPDRFQSVSGRVFDGAAAGKLVMTNNFADLEKAFEIGAEVVVYDDIEDAIEKARYYLLHDEEREAIARAGQKRALRDHTVMERVETIIHFIEEERSAHVSLRGDLSIGESK